MRALTPVEKLFLTRLLTSAAEKEVRRDVLAGRHDVDLIVRAKGPVLVGHPSTRAAWLQNEHYRAVIAMLLERTPKARLHLDAVLQAFSRDAKAFAETTIPADLSSLFREMGAQLPRNNVAGDIDASALEVEALEAADLRSRRKRAA